MPSITVLPEKKVISYKMGATLLEILLAEQVFIDNPCNGKGVCGKCKVHIIEGNLPEISATEKGLLSEDEIHKGIRLSCFIRPEGDLFIALLQKELKHEVLTTGYIPPFEIEADIRKQVVQIHRPTLDDQTPFEEQIKQQTQAAYCEFQLLTSTIFESGTYTAIIHDNSSNSYKVNCNNDDCDNHDSDNDYNIRKNCNSHIIGLECGDTTKTLYGVAIDIGTTTVVCALIDMKSGTELANASQINAQKHFGLDVLTRITYAIEHPEDGDKNLQKAIVDSINVMIEEVCEQTRIRTDEIYSIAVSANCTMMHMLLGVNTASIGKAPYAPMFVKSKNISASSIGLIAAAGARLYCLPSVSAYIGADIVAGAYVCELIKEQGNVLFIDIGTNGEIVLASKGKLLCCSCAAGPALEGMNISSGMRAAEGAIEDVKITEKGVEIAVIGNHEPIGICGSGILAVVRELIKTGLIRKNGAFIKRDKLDENDYRYPMIQLNGEKREFIVAENKKAKKAETNKILITQSDIRQVQLAKGAILSGFIALLKKAGICMEDLDKVMIAGQFGAHLPADSLTGTGILPKEIEDKLVYVGNSSKTGAYMALLSKSVKKEVEELAEQMDYMELGATEGYERLFSECLIFPVG